MSSSSLEWSRSEGYKSEEIYPGGQDSSQRLQVGRCVNKTIEVECVQECAKSKECMQECAESKYSSEDVYPSMQVDEASANIQKSSVLGSGAENDQSIQSGSDNQSMQSGSDNQSMQVCSVVKADSEMRAQSAQILNPSCVQAGRRCLTHGCKMTRGVMKDRLWKQKPNGLFGFRTVQKSVWECSQFRPTQPSLVF